MKRILQWLLIPVGLMGQSISITSPTPSQTISGTSFPFGVTLTSLPPVYSVEYDVNGEVACIARIAPWGCVWNTFYVYDNQYNSVTATARDALGNSPVGCPNNCATTVAFTVQNGKPVPSASMSWTIGAGAGPYTSPTSLAPSISGTDSGSGNETFFVDGLPLTQPNWGGGGTAYVNPSQFNDGVRNVVGVLTDTAGGLGPPNDLHAWNAAAQWEKQVTFTSPANTVMELRENAYEVFLCTTVRPNCPATFQLSGRMANTDESTQATVQPTYSSANTGIATVSGSGLLTAVAVGSTTIYATSRAFSGSDGVLVNTYFMQSPSHSFNRVGDYIQITNTGAGGTCTPGVYPVLSVSGFGSYAQIGTVCANGESGIAWNSGPARTIWVHVNTQNVLPHFGNDGSILTAYDPSKSLYLQTIYQGYGNLTNSPLPSYMSSLWQSVAAAGFNATSDGCDGGNATWTSSQGAWQALQTSWVASHVADLSPYGMYLFCTADNLSKGPEELGVGTVGPPASWSPSLLTNLFSSWTNNRMLGVLGGDEISALYGGVPQPGTITWGNPYLSSNTITVSGGVATIPLDQITIGGQVGPTFIIHGATTNTCLNSSASTGAVYTMTGYAGHTSITAASTCGNITATNITDPGLTIETFVKWWLNSDGSQCSSNCSLYNPDSSFATWMSLARAAAGGPKITWQPISGFNGTSVANWIGDPRMSDFATIYFPGPNSYLSQYTALSTLMNDLGNAEYRPSYSVLAANRLAPIVSISAATNVNYGLQGYTVNVTSCVNGLITFSNPHAIANVVPFDTRLIVSGSNAGTCDGTYYVIDTPTATTAHVALSQATFTNSYTPNNDGATGHFSSGATFPVYALASNTNTWVGSTSASSFENNSENNSCTTYNTPNHRGETVTFTQGTSSIGSFATTSWWFVPSPMSSNCTGPIYSGFIAQIPSGSTTGGTATIVANDSYVRGQTWPGPGNSERGPRYMFASSMYPMILGAAANLIYVAGPYNDDPSFHNFTAIFGDNSNQTIQAGIRTVFHYGGSDLALQADSVAAKLTTRFAKFEFQPRLPSPDYGQFFESTLRTGSYGNMLAVQSFADGALTRTIDLSSCVVNGQPTIKYTAGWHGIAVATIGAGTVSDTNVFNPDSAALVVYVCANNATVEYSPPAIAASLTDVPTASKILIQYSYLSAPLTPGSITGLMLPQVVDCGTGTCSLPVDRNIGTVYYRVLYVDSNGKLLATSDVQTL
jgi:Big-like domain-containing protein